MIQNLIAFPQILAPNGAGTDQEPYVTYSGLPIPINIQPESPIVTSMGDGDYFATYHFFTSYSGLQAGWRLTISGTNPPDIYTVRGVQRFNFGAGAHYEGTLIKPKQ